MAQRTGLSPDRFRSQRERGVPFFRCDICSMTYPEPMMKWQSGRRVCPDDYEAEGGEVERDLASARRIQHGASREANKRIPKYPWVPETSAAITKIVPKPLEMLVGAGPYTVDLTGVHLDSSVVLTYGGGITDDTPPVYASDGLSAVLSLDPGLTPGDFKLEINGRPIYNVFKVRIL